MNSKTFSLLLLILSITAHLVTAHLSPIIECGHNHFGNLTQCRQLIRTVDHKKWYGDPRYNISGSDINYKEIITPTDHPCIKKGKATDVFSRYCLLMKNHGCAITLSNSEYGGIVRMRGDELHDALSEALEHCSDRKGRISAHRVGQSGSETAVCLSSPTKAKHCYLSGWDQWYRGHADKDDQQKQDQPHVFYWPAVNGDVLGDAPPWTPPPPATDDTDATDVETAASNAGNIGSGKNDINVDNSIGESTAEPEKRDLLGRGMRWGKRDSLGRRWWLFGSPHGKDKDPWDEHHHKPFFSNGDDEHPICWLGRWGDGCDKNQRKPRNRALHAPFATNPFRSNCFIFWGDCSNGGPRIVTKIANPEHEDYDATAAGSDDATKQLAEIDYYGETHKWFEHPFHWPR
ncbi:MAG: hypothetical protein M1827_005351 [Pycnora praestabilis]|nr:MAG: hypothetical protein M1827_005351 [Pycnora praestabilis]